MGWNHPPDSPLQNDVTSNLGWWSTLPERNIFALKINGWKLNFVVGWPIFRVELLVLGSVGYSCFGRDTWSIFPFRLTICSWPNARKSVVKASVRHTQSKHLRLDGMVTYNNTNSIIHRTLYVNNRIISKPFISSNISELFFVVKQHECTSLKRYTELGGVFKHFLFSPWGNDPIWLIFFRWVETTNQTNEIPDLQDLQPEKRKPSVFLAHKKVPNSWGTFGTTNFESSDWRLWQIWRSTGSETWGRLAGWNGFDQWSIEPRGKREFRI